MRHREILTIEPDDVVGLIHEAVAARGEEWAYPDTSQCRYVYYRNDYQWAVDEAEYTGAKPDAAKMIEYFGDDNGAPACLVGYVLNLINPGLLYLAVEGNHNEDSVAGWMGYESGKDFVAQVGETEYVFPVDVIDLLQTAQAVQDSGQTWGSAETRVVQRIEAARGEV